MSMLTQTTSTRKRIGNDWAPSARPSGYLGQNETVKTAKRKRWKTEVSFPLREISEMKTIAEQHR